MKRKDFDYSKFIVYFSEINWELGLSSDEIANKLSCGVGGIPVKIKKKKFVFIKNGTANTPGNISYYEMRVNEFLNKFGVK